MVLLEISKPKRNLAHYKALVYADLYKKGFDVYLDVWNYALFEYTQGIKGYQKVKFDMVIFVDDKAKLIINFTKNTRRNTKIRMYKIPIIHIDVDKWEKVNPVKEIYKALNL